MPAPAPAAVPAAINVTIGRIEIRATPAMSPPRRSAARAGPQLSLEDYLRSRNGGGG
jgi:hypothetical protein